MKSKTLGRGSLALAVVCIGIGGSAKCQSAPKTVPGPESPAASAGLRGWVAMDQPVGGIVAVNVATGERVVVRAPAENIGTVHSIAGPDALGRVAFVENHMVEERHAIKLVQLDGEGERVVLKRDGDALWSHNGDEIGDFLALSPSGERVAFVRDLAKVKIPSATVLVTQGRLVLLDLGTGKDLPTSTSSIDEQPCFFPDGRRIAYTGLIDRASAVRALRDGSDQDFAKDLLAWERVPALHVLEIESGRTEFVHVGWRGIVSPDGKRMLVTDLGQHVRLLDLETRASRAVVVPGATPLGPVAWLDSHRVLYWGLPTEGAKVEWTEHNSPLVGRKSMVTLKSLDLDTGQFATLVPSVDPRRNVSFGVGP